MAEAKKKTRPAGKSIPSKLAPAPTSHGGETVQEYRVDQQIGLLIRRAHQRASAIFARHFSDAGLSPLQFTALEKIRDEGRVSQNQLGRLVYTDPATIMGVMKRLSDRDLIKRLPDPKDKRRTVLTITSSGLKLIEDLEVKGHSVTAETMEPLSGAERDQLVALLSKII